MWTIFNPTLNDISHPINFGVWELKAGETAKFPSGDKPNNIAQELVRIYGFLEVLDKDDEKPKKELPKPPADLTLVHEARGKPLYKDERKVVHPSSDPRVQENGGFSGEMTDSQAGLNLKKVIVGDRLAQIDKDGVEWYGKGAERDNPFAKE